MPFIWHWNLGVLISARSYTYKGFWSHEKWFNNHKSTGFSEGTFLPLAFTSPELCCKYYLFLRVPWQDGMWTGTSGVWPHRSWERVATGTAKEEEVQARRHSNSWPPNELVECQLVGLRDTKNPGLASFVKALPLSLFVPSCLGREIAVRGGRVQTPYPKGQFICQPSTPITEGGGDLLCGEPW